MTAKDALITEEEVGPEPPTPDAGDHVSLNIWGTWCAKCSVLRMAGLKDSVEIWLFHRAVEDLAAYAGNEELVLFLRQAFPRNSEAFHMANREVEPKWRKLH